MTTTDYLTVEQVAERLRLSVRQATRYADRVRTQRSGRRVLFHAGDVEALAQELGTEYRPPPQPTLDMVPTGEMREMVDARDRTINQLSAQLGYALGQLEVQSRMLEDTTAIQAKVEQLQRMIDRAKRRTLWQRIRDIWPDDQDD